MSYTTDPKRILEDITRRKEFYQYRMPEAADEEQIYDDEDQSAAASAKKYAIAARPDILEFQSYQNVPRMFINPNTPYRRLAAKWKPGMGKTIMAGGVAMPFLDMFERESQMNAAHVGSVFVFGFTEEIFKRDLLRFPQFGYTSADELRQLAEFQRAASVGGKTDEDRLSDYQNMLRRRLTSRKQRGYWVFMGYKAFVNRLFIIERQGVSLNDMDEAAIRVALADGRISLNRTLIESMKGSLVICDEFHHVYNSLEKNNWGVALGIALDSDPTIAAVFLSATLGNNSPSEYADVGNFMQPPGQKLSRDALFDGNRLRPGAIEKLVEVFRGRVSYIADNRSAALCGTDHDR